MHRKYIIASKNETLTLLPVNQFYIGFFSKFDGILKVTAMKPIHYLFISFVALFAVSCNSDENPTGETALFAVPVVKSLAEIRSSVGVSEAVETNSDGKIYVTEDALFYIAKEEGVHILDNSNPVSPQNTAFISLEGVHDIAVKGNFLYADNYVDLLVFDISDLENITLVKTVQNALSFLPAYPENAEFYDYTQGANEGEIIIGFELETRERPEGMMLEDFDSNGGVPTSNGGNVVGIGGSYAKFQINNDALYTVDSYQLNVFNISSPANTFYDKAVYLTEWMGGGEFETLFQQRDFLFVGSTTGMYVVDASDEFNPFFLSGFSHATACDPVVVYGNTAYITVRGGSSCGAIEDQINVINVTDMANPSLISTTLLDQPYGLGINNNILYVCTGSNGLKVFDASDSANLTLENSYTESVTDVIPLTSHLIAVGPNKIIQYNYGSGFSLTPISTVNF